MLVIKFLPRFFMDCIVYSRVSACFANAASVAPVASYIAAVFSVKFSACDPDNASIAVCASTDENILASACVSPFTVLPNASNVPCSPSDSNAAFTFAYPSDFNAFVIPSVGLIKPDMTAFICVDTSAVLPVTPVSVANAPYSSSCSTPSAEASGTTFPIELASSGNDVWPSFTVIKDKSDAFWNASPEVSPYPFVTAVRRLIASVVVAPPAAAAFAASSI